MLNSERRIIEEKSKGRYSKSPTNSKQLENSSISITHDKSFINISNSSKNLSRYAKRGMNTKLPKTLTFRDKQQTANLNNDSLEKGGEGSITPIQFNESKLPLTSKSISHKSSLSFLLSKLSPIKKSTISQQMSKQFVEETILIGSRGSDKFKNYQQVRKKIMNDFQDKTTNDSIQSSRQNYNQTVLFLELNHLKEVKKSQAFEKQFYQMRKANLYYGKGSEKTAKESKSVDATITYIESRNNYFLDKERKIETTIRQLGKELIGMDCDEYESLYNKKNKKFDKINFNNLQRKMKIYSIAKNKYDEDNDDLIMKNIPKLKALVKTSEEEVIRKLKNYTPMFMKTNFRSKTMKRFKAASGYNFGVPS